MIECVASPKSQRVQVTVTINRRLLKSFDRECATLDRNRSEMMDRVIEFYFQHHPQRHDDASKAAERR